MKESVEFLASFYEITGPILQKMLRVDCEGFKNINDLISELLEVQKNNSKFENEMYIDNDDQILKFKEQKIKNS